MVTSSRVRDLELQGLLVPSLCSMLESSDGTTIAIAGAVGISYE